MSRKNNIEHIISALRPKQWIKNLFIFIPLIFGISLLEFLVFLKVVAAFVLFCLMASVVYLMNDIFDVNEDKIHPLKKSRPLASEKITLRMTVFLIIILWTISLLGSFYLDIAFGWVLVTYFLLNIIYSIFIKKIVIIDVLFIGVFFLLRIIGGTVIVKVEYSHWMIFMIVLLAIFLGFNKRRQELKIYGNNAINHRSVLSSYNPYFLDQMISVTTSAIVIAYMIYTVDERTKMLFGSTHMAYTIPFVFYGVFRYLYLVHIKNIDGEPSSVILKDKTMLVNILLWVLMCILVIYFKL